MKYKLWIGGIFALMAVLIVCIVITRESTVTRQPALEKTKEDSGSSESKEELEIGVSFDSLILERWQRDRDILVSVAQEQGAQVNFQNANGVLDTQVEQIEYFIKNQVDAIVIVAVTSEDPQNKLKEAIADAHEAGIPVIAYDRLILNADVDCYISFDNKEVGRLMGEHMKEHLGGEGKLLQICGPMADYNVPQVMEGFQEALEGTNITIVETDYAENWTGEKGFSFTSEFLNKNTAPNGIMCGNDSIAGNAIKALSERRLSGSVCVVGQDADLDACQRIVEGTQCMTVYKPAEQEAKMAAQITVTLAKGEDISVDETINDGSYDVPYEKLAPILVNKDNMDEVITGKYHEESDIYLNVSK